MNWYFAAIDEKKARQRQVVSTPTAKPTGDGLHPYAAAAIGRELDRLDGLRPPWHEGDGWDTTTYAVACNLIEFANSPWSGYSLADAERDLLAHAPHDGVWGPKEQEVKWRSACQTVGAHGRPEPLLGAPAVLEVAAGELTQNGSSVPRSSWAPVELAGVVDGLLDGSLVRPRPTVGRFGDRCLFYEGRINGIHGDSNAGKTWTALVVCKQELEAGRVAMYVDLEDHEVGIVGRLLDIGADPAAVAERFVYARPHERLNQAGVDQVVGLLERRPSVAVIDSAGEALALEGANPNHDEEVARWFRLLPRLLASAGAAVLLLDHATKAGDNELFAIGSQRKRAAINGAQYLQKVVQPFSAGRNGSAILICAKDRNGVYYPRQRVAELRVATTMTGVEIVLGDAEQAVAVDGRFRPTVYMARVSRALQLAGEPLSFTRLRDEVGGKRDYVSAAVKALMAEGCVIRSSGPHRTTLHTLVRPFSEDSSEAGTTDQAEVGPNGGPGGPGPKDGDRGTTGVGDPQGPLGTTGDHQAPCPIKGHSPRLRSGRWSCPECEAAS